MTAQNENLRQPLAPTSVPLMRHAAIQEPPGPLKELIGTRVEIHFNSSAMPITGKLLRVFRFELTIDTDGAQSSRSVVVMKHAVAWVRVV